MNPIDRNSNTLITGADGFIGSHLTEALVHQGYKVRAFVNDAGLMTRPVWTLMHQMPMYRNAPKVSLPVAESLEWSLINIPSSSGLVPVNS